MHSIGIHRRSDRQTDTQTDIQTLVAGPTAIASWPTILILTYDSDLQSHASYCHDLLTYDCESWTLRKNEGTRLEASDWWLRTILCVLWTAKKTNEWVLSKAGVKRELLDTVKARKLAYCGNCLEKEIMQGARSRGRPRTAWIDNIKTRTGLLWKNQSEWHKTEINGESMSMVWPTLGSRMAKEQNRKADLAEVLPAIL